MLLTVGLGTDEARCGAVEEGKEARYSQADVCVGGSKIKCGETGELHLQYVLRGHLHIWHLMHRQKVTVVRTYTQDVCVYLVIDEIERHCAQSKTQKVFLCFFLH